MNQKEQYNEVMGAMDALSIVEGITEVETEEEVLEAWQCLVDTELAWALPGRIGRMAHNLIEEGLISA